MNDPKFLYMFYGFSAAWVVLALYVLTLVGREKKINKQLEGLRRMMEDKGGKG